MPDRGTQSGNPLRDLPRTEFNVAIDSDSLVVDEIYGVGDVVRRYWVQGQSQNPDPRLSGPGPQGNWAWPPKPNPPIEGWVSSPALGGDHTLDDTVLHYAFDRKQLINRMSFEVSNVPCNWSVWYIHGTKKIWLQMTDKRGVPLKGTLSGQPLPKNSTGTNLQSAVARGEWVEYDFILPNIDTWSIEIRLDRRVAENLLPRYFGTGLAKPYSVAVRNLHLQYEVFDWTHKPHYDTDIRFKHPLGFIERVVAQDYDSSKSIDGNDSTYWMSSAQATHSSKVPYYMDVRDDSGGPQLVDRLRMTPLTSGQTMNIYYTKDDTVGDFYLSSQPQNFTIAGSAQIQNQGLLTNTNAKAATIDNTMRVDLEQDWMVGLTYHPSDITGTTQRFLWEFKNGSSLFGLCYDPTDNKFKFMKNGSTMLAQTPAIVVNTNSDYGVVVGYNHTDAVISRDEDDSDTTIRVDVPDYLPPTPFTIQVESEQMQVTSILERNLLVVRGYNSTTATSHPSGAKVTVLGGSAATLQSGYYLAWLDPTTSAFTKLQTNIPSTYSPGFFPTSFTLGNNAALGKTAKGYVSQVFVRQDAFHPNAAKSFLEAPNLFVTGQGPLGRANGYFRAVLAARLLKNTQALVGPGAGFYEAKRWKPLFRDYYLQKGTTFLPVVHAKYMKLEFSKLAGRPYPLHEGTKFEQRDYPKWVEQWYEDVFAKQGQDPSRFHFPPTHIDQFEDVSRKKLSPRIRLPQVQNALDTSFTAFASSELNVHERGMEPIDLYTDDDEAIDSTTALKMLQQDTMRKRFFQEGVHNYDIKEIEPREAKAYFVGVREARAYRVDYTPAVDTAEYVETFLDTQHILSNTMTILSEGGLVSTAPDQAFTSKNFSSLSRYQSVQIATMNSEWESQMSDDQMSLVLYSHLNDTSSTTRIVVTGQFASSGAGNLLEFSRTTGQTGTYGTKTRTGIFTIGGTTIPWDAAYLNEPWDNTDRWDGIYTLDTAQARTSAMARIFLPETNTGSYELRLYAKNGGSSTIVKRQPFTAAVQSWVEIELGYMSKAGDSDFQAEIVQTNTNVSEPFILDFLGIWQNPVRWELSNDNGSTWKPVLYPIDNPDGYYSFSSSATQLKIRGTALRAGAIISGYTLVPWYLDSPLVRRLPMDYDPPWGQSEAEDLRATKHKPMFQQWFHLFPQKYSLLSPTGTIPVGDNRFTP